MPIPSLLTIGQKQGIPYQTFDDLQLRRLLDEKTIRILSYPAGKEELLQRQELFGVLRTEAGLARIKDVFAALKEYERAVRLWRSTSIEVEKRFLFAAALSQYRIICSMLSSLSDCGAKLAAVLLTAKKPLRHCRILTLILMRCKNSCRSSASSTCPLRNVPT